jgi:hypothetical protein
MQLHLELRIEKLTADGMSGPDARDAAFRSWLARGAEPPWNRAWSAGREPR